jgi:hypothetical protein
MFFLVMGILAIAGFLGMVFEAFIIDQKKGTKCSSRKKS